MKHRLRELPTPGLAFVMIIWLSEPMDLYAASITEAVEAQRAWRERISNLTVNARRWETADKNPDLSCERAEGHWDFTWEDGGRFREACASSADERRSWQLRLADRDRYYRFTYAVPRAGLGEIPAKVYVMPNTVEYSRSPFHHDWLPHWNNDKRVWLGDVLNEMTPARVTDEGLLEVDGDLVALPGRDLLLDPAHSYLPVEIVHRTEDFVISVDEFREVEPGFWMPWKGKSVGGPIYIEWELEHVALNTVLSDDLFDPKIRDETKVVDRITGREYWKGGRVPDWALRLQQPPTPEAAPVNAEPVLAEAERTGGERWSLWLVLFGAACVAGGAWLRRRA